MAVLSMHTAGPWIVTDLPEKDGDGEWVGEASIKTADGQLYIATIHGGMIRSDPEANARVIASAPDLLKAIRYLLLDSHTRAWLEAHDPKALDQLELAVGKATGEVHS